MNLTSNVSILHDGQEWTTDVEGVVNEVKVDGRKLSDIHTLTMTVSSVTKEIRILAVVSVAMALLATGLAAWGVYKDNELIGSFHANRCISEEERIKVSNTNGPLSRKLNELGWKWDQDSLDFVRIKPEISKRN